MKTLKARVLSKSDGQSKDTIIKFWRMRSQKNPDTIVFDPLLGPKLLAMASIHLRQTEQPVKVGMTVTHKSYGAGKVVGEWGTIRSGVPCKDIFDVIFQNRSGRPFLHCCRKEYLTPDPLSLP